MIKPLGVFDLGSFEEFSAMEQDRLQKARIEQLEAALKNLIYNAEDYGVPPRYFDEARAALTGEKKDD
jgi:hypothetical protein